MSAHLLTRGIIHSTTDPYAQALLVRDGMIAWLGADDSADRVADPGDERRDLDGAVVVPVFVEPLARPADARDALSRGTAVVTVLAGPEDTGAAPADEEGFALVEQLEKRLGQPAAADLALTAGIYISEQALGFLPDGSISRYNVSGRVDWRLTRITDGSLVLSGSERSFTSYSATSTTVATIFAQRDARRRLMVILADRIVQDLLMRADAL